MTDPAPRVASPPRRVAAIINPHARRSLASVQRALRSACPPDARLTILVSSGPGETTLLARAVRDDVDLVVAVGGDGTVSEVATGLVGSDVPLAIVPSGSTNIVAREHGVPTGLRSATRLVFGPHLLVPRDLGRCGERFFLHMAGAGLDARFFERTSRELKRHVGWLAYIPAAAQALAEPPAQMTVTADDVTITTGSPLVLVANGGSVVHPAIRLHPAIRSDDGWLDVFVFKGTDPIGLGRTIVRFSVGQLGESSETEVIRARRVEIESYPKVPVQLDGDGFGTTPIVIDVVPAAVRLVIPPRRAGGFINLAQPPRL